METEKDKDQPILEEGEWEKIKKSKYYLPIYKRRKIWGLTEEIEMTRQEREDFLECPMLGIALLEGWVNEKFTLRQKITKWLHLKKQLKKQKNISKNTS